MTKTENGVIKYTPQEKEIANKLLLLGIQPNFRGYLYIIVATRMVIANPVISMTKELYPAVAEEINQLKNSKLNLPNGDNISPQGVERNIRHCIETATANCTPEWVKLTGMVSNVKMTNSLFLALVAEEFRLMNVS